MRVFIAGVDGYLGWSLAQHLVKKGHEVSGCDNYSRRDWVGEMGSESATPIVPMEERLEAFQENFSTELGFRQGDLCDSEFAKECLDHFRPEAIVHLAEMPSAPYSMIDADHCAYTHHNNLTGTLNLLFAMREVTPDAHLVKLGTMGEYGTPDIDIPEGFFDITYRGREAKNLPFPRQAGSWYHWTKVHDSNNVMFACRIWGLRSTDIMQGVVFGTRIEEMGDDERLITRFDFDQCFGTAINRFCAQAVIGEPLTPYGAGGQKRGFLPLIDSVRCLTLAVENPPAEGEYRVFNQFQKVYDILGLAEMVQRTGAKLGLDVQIRNRVNPRMELEQHYYNPDRQHLIDLGYEPTEDIEGEMETMLRDLQRYRSRIAARKEALTPDILWKSARREKMGYRDEPADGGA